MEIVYTPGAGAACGAARSVTVVPPAHLEWQPPHIDAVSGSWSATLIVKMRQPESSIGANEAPHTPQRWSASDLVRFRESVRLVIRHRNRRIRYTPRRMPTEPRPDWAAIEQTAEFRALVRAKRAFIVPASLFFVVYYFALPALVGYFPNLMSIRVAGQINVAYLFALSQFAMAWTLMAAYVRRARTYDRMADAVKQQPAARP